VSEDIVCSRFWGNAGLGYAAFVLAMLAVKQGSGFDTLTSETFEQLEDVLYHSPFQNPADCFQK